MNDKALEQSEQENAAQSQDAADDAAIWKELQAAETGETTEEPSDGDRSDEDAGTQTQPPAEKAGTDQQHSAEAPAEAAAPNGTQPADPEAERLTREKEIIEQRMRSDSGRLAAISRKVADLAKAASPRKEDAADDLNELLKPLATDYPEVEGPLKKVVEGINGKISQLSEAEKSRREAAQFELNNLINDQTALLNEAHPDYIEVLKTAGPTFKNWLEDQPKRIRDAAEINSRYIVDAASANAVIESFKRHIGLIKDEPVQTQETKPLDDRRQRQMAGTATPTGSSRTPVISGIPEEGDPEQIWDALRRQEEARARR